MESSANTPTYERTKRIMAMTDEALSLEQLNKGSFKGYVRHDNVLDLWFSSPTGDSSDSVIFTMTCLNGEQAQEIADMHLKVWGLINY